MAIRAEIDYLATLISDSVIVGNHDDRSAGSGLFLQQGQHAVTVPTVESRSWFIRQDEARGAYQDTGKRNSLLFAAA